MTVNHLIVGKHSFEVRAVDMAGNKSDTEIYGNENRRAVKSWEVVPTVELIQPSTISAADKNTCSTSTPLNSWNLYCWGNKSATNTTTNELGVSRKPVYIGSVSTSFGFSASANHMCLINSSKDLWCYGSNTAGELGISPWGNPRIYELPVLFKISNYEQSGQSTYGIKKLTQYHTDYGVSCGIEDGWARCWGGIWNQNGWGNYTVLKKQMEQIVINNTYYCALKLGTVWCWGKITNLTGIEKIYSEPTRVGSLVGVQQLAISNYGACALASGSVSCWGFNEYGFLGTDAAVGALIETPVVISGLESNVQRIAGGRYSNCAIKNDSAFCWGVKLQGQSLPADLAASTFHSSPTLVTGLESNVQDIGIGLSHGCAKVGVDLKCWGDNSEGQIGDDTNDDRTTPTKVVFGE